LDDEKYQAEQDAHLTAIGLTRTAFPNLLGVVVEDEHIRVWCSGPASWVKRPANLIDIEPGMDEGHVEYIFLPLDASEQASVEADCGY
jgi:hypothetical protein